MDAEQIRAKKPTFYSSVLKNKESSRMLEFKKSFPADSFHKLGNINFLKELLYLSTKLSKTTPTHFAMYRRRSF